MGLYLPMFLEICSRISFVFICHDTHCTPLQHPYKGLYKMLQPGVKAFKINRGGRPDTISVNLSQHTWTWNTPPSTPQYSDLEGEPLGPPKLFLQIWSNPTVNSPNTSQQLRTHSGHRIRLPQCYILVLGEQCGGKDWQTNISAENLPNIVSCAWTLCLVWLGMGVVHVHCWYGS